MRPENSSQGSPSTSTVQIRAQHGCTWTGVNGVDWGDPRRRSSSACAPLAALVWSPPFLLVGVSEGRHPPRPPASHVLRSHAEHSWSQRPAAFGAKAIWFYSTGSVGKRRLNSGGPPNLGAQRGGGGGGGGRQCAGNKGREGEGRVLLMVAPPAHFPGLYNQLSLWPFPTSGFTSTE